MSRDYEVRFNVVDTTKFEQFEPIFQEEIAGSMATITEKVASDANARAPVDRNFFRNSIQPLVFSPIEDHLAITGQVVATAPHAAIIEGVDEEGNETQYGRRPGSKFPPLDDLRLWVERHIAPNEALNPGSDDDAEEIDRITFLVGRAIARRGLIPENRQEQPGRPIGDAFRANLEFIDEEIQLGIDRVLTRM